MDDAAIVDTLRLYIRKYQQNFKPMQPVNCAGRDEAGIIFCNCNFSGWRYFV